MVTIEWMKFSIFETSPPPAACANTGVATIKEVIINDCKVMSFLIVSPPFKTKNCLEGSFKNKQILTMSVYIKYGLVIQEVVRDEYLGDTEES